MLHTIEAPEKKEKLPNKENFMHCLGAHAKSLGFRAQETEENSFVGVFKASQN